MGADLQAATSISVMQFGRCTGACFGGKYVQVRCHHTPERPRLTESWQAGCGKQDRWRSNVLALRGARVTGQRQCAQIEAQQPMMLASQGAQLSFTLANHC